MLGNYVWYKMETKLHTQGALLLANTAYPQLARELHLVQLHISLINYIYSQQKMAIIKDQYKATQSLYHLSLQRLVCNINQQEVNSRSLEAMATHLNYLQATLDNAHAYTKLLASSHLPPNTWQQSLERLPLANENFSAMSDIINLSPANCSEETVENSDPLVSVTGYTKSATGNRHRINYLALLHHLKNPQQRTTISTAAKVYLWQIDLGTAKKINSTQALLTQEPELAYLVNYQPSSTSSSRLTASGLGHSQVRILCERLK